MEYFYSVVLLLFGRLFPLPGKEKEKEKRYIFQNDQYSLLGVSL